MNARRIFVYGTLKRNEPNNHHMEKIGAKFISIGRTVKQWPLVIHPERNVPMLLNTNKLGKVRKKADENDCCCRIYFVCCQRIKGEIYEVNQEAVEFLDEFEGVHLNYYSNMKIDIEAESGLIEQLSTYVMDNFNEITFLNENTVFFDDYTEKNGIFGEYRHRCRVGNYDMDKHLKDIKNKDFFSIINQGC